jgi:hypothetical protein
MVIRTLYSEGDGLGLGIAKPWPALEAGSVFVFRVRGDQPWQRKFYNAVLLGITSMGQRGGRVRAIKYAAFSF